ncbi:hypothetical protein PPYR_07060 [Photinus pyralis]|uniref:Uncharacterized protein n=1 Tax=Photinus pyralis TaxID=7054 RepID=A0A5N4APC5_PHOPY|nr:hypothetical protein PPYR_07060 [Photinus pyralis]
MDKDPIHDVRYLSGGFDSEFQRFNLYFKIISAGKGNHMNLSDKSSMKCWLYGAAVQAEYLAVIQSDVTPLSLGIETLLVGVVHDQKSCERNSRIPCKQTPNISNLFHNQPGVRYPSIRSANRAMTKDNN